MIDTLTQVSGEPAEGASSEDGVFAFLVVRNEILRIKHCLEHYRNIGIARFFIVDNGSDDGTLLFLKAQPDVILFETAESYSQSRLGVDWTQSLLDQYASGRWALIVDADELFVYEKCETRSINSLCENLDAQNKSAFFAILLDMYSDRPIAQTYIEEGKRLIDTCMFFDRGPYQILRSEAFPFFELQGGPRQRLFWDPRARPIPPTVSKVPLVKWRRGSAFLSSTHYLLHPAGILADSSGALLHFKFCADFHAKAETEARRGEHFEGALEYKQYLTAISRNPRLGLRFEGSSRYKSSQSLVDAGLMVTQKTDANAAVRRLSPSVLQTLSVTFGQPLAESERNQLCHCGSNKKYKHCHGRRA